MSLQGHSVSILNGQLLAPAPPMVPTWLSDLEGTTL